MDYFRPQRLSEAVAHLALGPCRVLAGGTDLYPTAAAALHGPVVDLTAVSGLRGISRPDGALRIGAATTWTDIITAPLPPALHGLQQAARQVGGRQIQNAGTLGGNLCTASPAADGVPPLLALDARLELASAVGVRHLALADFLLGPRRTALMPGEVLGAVIIPKAALSGRAAFVKLGARSHLVISIVMVAARVVREGDTLRGVAVAVGSCSAVAQRLWQVEHALTGAPCAQIAARVRHDDVAAALAPLDDIRASASYRLAAATELVIRAVTEAAG